MPQSNALRIAAALGFLAVALGALGAHGKLHDLLDHNQTASFWEKAVFYQFIHTVMLFVLAGRAPLRRGPWFCFLVGIVLFSGSLYVLALTNIRKLGAVTPFGGLSFLAGWLWLVIAPPVATSPSVPAASDASNKTRCTGGAE
jgi:uncharacterized membrane protein YgdD (TMEM256/DUF423 family)